MRALVAKTIITFLLLDSTYTRGFECEERFGTNLGSVCVCVCSIVQVCANFPVFPSYFDVIPSFLPNSP